MNHVFISHCICDEDKQVLTDLKKKLTEHNITFNDLD
jgi:hypothetical protein